MARVESVSLLTAGVFFLAARSKALAVVTVLAGCCQEFCAKSGQERRFQVSRF